MAKEETRITGDTVYRKVGRKYEPIGMCTPIDWFNEGIWLLRKHPHSKQYTSADYLYEMVKICNLSKEPTIQEIEDIHACAEYILSSNEWREFTKKSHSLLEEVMFILGKSNEYNKHLKEELKK